MLRRLRLVFGTALRPDLVEEVDDDVVLLYSKAIEMLAHSSRQLVCGLSPEIFLSCYGGRVATDAASLGEHPVVVFFGVGGRGVEAVYASVSMEYFSIECRPLELEGHEKLASGARGWLDCVSGE